MEHALTKSALSLMLAASLVGSATWSTDSHACANDPFIGAVCIMATPYSYGSFNGGTYVPANGAVLSMQQYAAAYSLIGTSYGGSGTNFMLPDLRGRVVVGSGSFGGAGPVYTAGQVGGAASVVLTAAQMPAHAHNLTGAGATGAVGIGTLAAGTTLTGLTTTTNLTGVSFTSSTSSLSIKALSTNGSSATPSSSSYMAKSGLPSATVYTTSTPDTVMAPGSVVGTVSGTLSGTAPGTVGGTATTTLTGAPVLSGATAPTGTGSAVPVMPPYQVLTYYFALQGLYPSRD